MAEPSILRRLYRQIVPLETRMRIYKLRNPGHYRRLRSVVHPSARGDFSLRPNDQHRCIFVHIPKAAGISVAESLFGYLPYHYTTLDYRVIYGTRTFREYFKFTFVRNPWDRLFSAYRFLKRGGWNEKDRKWAEENMNGFADFNEFVEGWLTPESASTMMHFRPQWSFICNRHLEIEVDFLGYLETIEEDFAYVANRLGIETSLQHKNASAKADYRAEYGVGARHVVEEVYRHDIDLFGYDFDGIGRRRVLPGAPDARLGV